MTSAGKKLLFLLSVCIFCLVALAVAAEIILYRHAGYSWLLGRDTGSTSMHDPLLGWSAKPNSRRQDRFGEGADTVYDARGFQSSVPYGPRSTPGKYRILILGDSFADGYGVGTAASFPALLQAQDPSLEVINAARGAYGIDQMALRYQRDAADLEADLVLLAFIPNDLDRTQFDRFVVARPKPRFTLAEDGSLELRGVPVPDFREPTWNPLRLAQRSGLALLARRAFFMNFVEWDRQALAAAIFDRVRSLADERGHGLGLVYLPELWHLQAHISAEEPLPDLAWAESYARTHGLRFVDVSIPMGRQEDILACYLKEWGAHFSPAGHRVAARAIADELGQFHAPDSR